MGLPYQLAMLVYQDAREAQPSLHIKHLSALLDVMIESRSYEEVRRVLVEAIHTR